MVYVDIKVYLEETWHCPDGFDCYSGLFFALEAKTGRELWSLDIVLNVVPALVDGVLYAGSIGRYFGKFLALDPLTGEVLWKFELPLRF